LPWAIGAPRRHPNSQNPFRRIPISRALSRPSSRPRLAKSIVAFGSLCVAAGLAFAGECPADKRAPEKKGTSHWWKNAGTTLVLLIAGASYKVIRRAVHIHPTVTELIPTLLGNLTALGAAK
jgi:hypothetical protein